MEEPAVSLKQEQHKFFDLKNTLPLTLSGLALAGDLYTTRRGLNDPRMHESNFLARPFVRSTAGNVFYGLSSIGAEVGGMYIAHKRGWHRLERWLPIAITASEALYIRHNIVTMQKK